MFKLGHKILHYSHFKILAQECTGWCDGIDSELFGPSVYISVAIKASLLKFNMFNMCKNTIFKMFLVFSNFKIVDLK